MSGFIDTIKARSARAARQAGVGAVGTFLILVGVGFLTSAAWIVLAELGTPLLASVVIGIVYNVAGLVCVGVVVASNGKKPPLPPEDRVTARPDGKRAATFPPLAEAFFFGLNAGLAADRRHAKHDPPK